MSDLLKSNLARNNTYLQQRVHAAVIQVSHEQRNSEGSAGLFARMVLADASQRYPDFMLEVSTNPSVINVLVLADDYNTVTSTQVGDQDIIYIVNGAFQTIAEKYAPQQSVDEQ